MLKDEPRWNASFMAMLFRATRIECYSIWAIDVMAMGELKLQCVQGHIQG